MAEGLLRHIANPASFTVNSAGTEKTAVRPEAIAVMKELGIDISKHTSKTLEQFLGIVDVVITVCDGAHQTCPYFPGTKKRLHWPIPDPGAIEGTESERLRAFRNARDLLQQMITAEFL